MSCHPVIQFSIKSLLFLFLLFCGLARAEDNCEEFLENANEANCGELAKNMAELNCKLSPEDIITRRCNCYSESSEESSICKESMTVVERLEDTKYKIHVWNCFEIHSEPEGLFACIYDYILKPTS